MDGYVYDVAESADAAAPFGRAGAFHLKPRPRATRRPGELTVELWIAPELRYLPVRIRIEQDAGDLHRPHDLGKPEIGEAATVRLQRHRRERKPP